LLSGSAASNHRDPVLTKPGERISHRVELICWCDDDEFSNTSGGQKPTGSMTNQRFTA